MSIIENIKIALSSIFVHKMRSILTMLGIIIGISSVIFIVALGQGGTEQLKSLIVGPGNTVSLTYMPSEEEIQKNPTMLWTPFTEDDIRAVESIPEVAKVVTSSESFGTVRFRENHQEAYIAGVNQAYIEVNELHVASGRNLLASDFLGARRTAVINAKVQEELFEDVNPLGEIIYIDAQPFEIVGILEKPEGLLSSFDTMTVYIPWETLRAVTGENRISYITIQAENTEDLQIAGEKAAHLLNQIHGTEDAYQVLNMEQIAEGISQITGIMTMIIGSIAGISLLVGGIGVMNIMLVSVTERTREIGIRMALGATRGQILFQFLTESVTLTLIGGMIGIIFGSFAAMIVSAFIGFTLTISLPVILIGLGFSMVIGIIFGILPANKASNLDPIESLRYE